MISYTRTATIAPGKIPGAMAFAQQVTKYVNETHRANFQVSVPVGGVPFRLHWRGTFENLAEMEKVMRATMMDEKYVETLTKSGDLFLPGSVNDEIWQSL